MKRKMPAAGLILAALVLGIVVGYMIFVSYPDKKTAAQIAGYVSILSDVFLRLIKMLIGPLVFSTLVVGIAHMGDAASVGRVFAKALGWFGGCSTCCHVGRTTAVSAPRNARHVVVGTAECVSCGLSKTE